MIYVTAYIMLDRERQHTAHIPWSKFVQYAEFYNFTADQTDWLIEIGFRVDDEIVRERIKKATSNGHA